MHPRLYPSMYSGCKYLSTLQRRLSTSKQETQPLAVYLFHRHGDRAPSKSILCTDDTAGRSSESAFWSSRLVSPSSGTPKFSFADANACFPVWKYAGLSSPSDPSSSRYTPVSSDHCTFTGDPSSHTGDFLDVHNMPYGYLTKVGMEGMVGVGERIGELYGRDWEVKCYSTNYLRTGESFWVGSGGGGC
jgi:hypothetical protein